MNTVTTATTAHYNPSIGQDEEAAIRCELAATRCKLSICAARSIAYVIHHNFCPEKDFHAFFTKILHAVYEEEPREIKQAENPSIYIRSFSRVLSAISATSDTCYYSQEVEEHNLQAWFAEHKWTRWLVAYRPAYMERSLDPLDDQRVRPRIAHSFAVSKSNGTEEIKKNSHIMFTKVDAGVDFDKNGVPIYDENGVPIYRDHVQTEEATSTHPGMRFLAILSHPRDPMAGSQCTHNSTQKPSYWDDDNSDLPWKPSPTQGDVAIPPEMVYEEEHPSC